MIQKNKTCVVCGKQYTYCSGCGFQEPNYRKSMCSLSCRDIYRTLSAYNMHNIEAEEAAQRLRACDLSNLNSFKVNIKKEIEAILKAVPEKEEPEEEPKETVKQEHSADKKEPQGKPALVSHYKADHKQISAALGSKK